jgi:hypothetical protein
MRKLIDNITVVCIDCNKVGEAISSMNKTLAKIQPHSAILFTDVDISIEGIETIVIPKINSKEAYSTFVVKELWKYITTSHVLIVQWDSWILNEEIWTDEFLDYDTTGALWLYNDGRDNGNGGFSIKSKRLLNILATDPFIEITHPEDEICGRLYRKYLETNYDIKFAPESLCDLFSFECREPYQRTLGFHSFFHQPFREHIVIRRTHGATGDIIMAEPIIEYFAKYNYQVVLDIPLDDMKLFLQYPYFLKHISQMNKKIKPIKVINLDMAYEIKPKQLVLKSYYEMAGIKDGELRNSRLYMHQEPHQKIFQKYILIHNDQVNLPHRNSYGVNWELIVAYFQKLGYLVFQIGNNPIEHIAPHYNCPTKDMLMYMCKGADLVIALDSGVAQISVALGTPTIIMAGSVDITLRYSNFEKIGVVQGDCPKSELKNCYHNSIGTTGVKCVINESTPPCSLHNVYKIIEQANKLLNK